MSRIVPENAPLENQINLFFHNHKLGELLRQSNIRKDKGVSLDTLFQFLLTIAFTGKNLFRLLATPDTPDIPPGIGKDVVYRFLNCVSSNWRKFLLLLSTRVIMQKLLPLTDDSTTKVLIADDTLYLRDHSKCVELLARVHDHNTKMFCLSRKWTFRPLELMNYPVGPGTGAPVKERAEGTSYVLPVNEKHCSLKIK
jgi:hypothetical protein